ncbi:MAG: type V CRISPR-associated protein Cas4 [Sulfurovum sp.]|nr:type V CRISPR-associated protein Cas4 [Sulfurovum sp.]MCB4763640.1 type V CRISPR-associated protein Cas4 [Sulfurovum sp.]MCB4773425.1 type V CRISPR-associated protein Cas4 [Sulfurovum sp.]MCB4779280.1 type V CRISPR-associated protein Cas4 [Sulfurovum sp.]MCB4781073.1 type V CRISPR-associated protein Cas4 [Sulfurovum sp.]
MESYIPISFLNDFIFCPRSIYFHQLYGRMESRLYQSRDQIDGKAAHKTIDTKTYTTSKKVLQSLEIYSKRYGLAGKIDTYDKSKQQLTERKKKIVHIYDGYVFQLYAQYYCLEEMGYEVKSIRLYSMDDNRVYPIQLPMEDINMKNKFDSLIRQIHSFSLDEPFSPNPNKCTRCIYTNLCDVSYA